MQLAALTQKAAEKPAFTQVPIPPAFLQLLRSLHTQKAAAKKRDFYKSRVSKLRLGGF